MEQTTQDQQKIRRVRRTKAQIEADNAIKYGASITVDNGCDQKAAEYAVRVWNGQCPDLIISERIKRVKSALERQGLIASGVMVGGQKL